MKGSAEFHDINAIEGQRHSCLASEQGWDESALEGKAMAPEKQLSWVAQVV